MSWSKSIQLKYFFQKKYAFLILPFCLLSLIISGCQSPKEKSSISGYEELHKSLRKEQKALSKARRHELQLERNRRKKTEKYMEPLLPSYNPLQEVPISLTVNQQPLPTVLSVVARNAGLNLIIDPDINLDKPVTVNFESTPSSVVVEKLLQSYDLAWSIKNNCLHVQKFEERIFELDFLNTSTSAKISSGGDIFGSSSANEDDDDNNNDNNDNNDNELEGNFEIKTSLARGNSKGSLYSYLFHNVKEVVKSSGQGSKGTVNLDTVSGHLYVRTSPRKMEKIARMVDNLKAKMKRQVVIDARILEVQLSDSFSLGIDWSYMAQALIGNYKLNVDLGWISDTGFGTNTFTDDLEGQASSLIIDDDPGATGEDYSDTFQATINVLQTFGNLKTVSNPHVRVRHAQPALVTSGTTKSYVREITRDRYDSDNVYTSYSTDTASAFEGVMLGVIPFITSNHGVDLQIFPINSQVDLSNESQVGENQITLPEINVRNVNTNVRVNNGDTIILGGLISKQKQNNDRQTPVAGDIPGLGWLFKHRETSSTVQELVIIMHVRVI